MPSTSTKCWHRRGHVAAGGVGPGRSARAVPTTRGLHRASGASRTRLRCTARTSSRARPESRRQSSAPTQIEQPSCSSSLGHPSLFSSDGCQVTRCRGHWSRNGEPSLTTSVNGARGGGVDGGGGCEGGGGGVGGAGWRVLDDARREHNRHDVAWPADQQPRGRWQTRDTAPRPRRQRSSRRQRRRLL